MPFDSVKHLNNNSGSSTSLWMEVKIPSPPSLQANLQTDVCIIGAGIVGLTCAYLLSQQGKSVIVLDKGPIAGGQSARTTGHLTWILDDRFSDLEQLFGEEGSRLAMESHRAAVDQIERIIQEEHIDCDFERVDAYLFTPPENSKDILNQELAAIKKAGILVHQVERAPFPTFDTGPCLRFPHQAQFHILKYLSGIIPVILKRGVQIFSGTQVKECKGGTPCHVITNQEAVITSQAVIVATNTPINDRFIMHTKQAPYRTYVIAACIPQGAIPKGLYWDTLDPYHYVRIQKHLSDPHHNWILIGGEDHKTGQEEAVLQKYDLLEQWARERFPMMGQIDYRWSGQIMEPVDSLAFIGRNPRDENVYIATGDSGNGLTHGTIAGMLLTDLILGKDNPWTELYDPSRKTLSATTEFAKENFNVATQYVEWIMPGQINSIDQIASGTGAIIREGLKKLAVYRDEQGDIHCYSAICPHLGCIVAWNSAETSWDCPCHGSRFDVNGKILNGPAISSLTRCQSNTKQATDTQVN